MPWLTASANTIVPACTSSQEKMGDFDYIWILGPIAPAGGNRESQGALTMSLIPNQAGSFSPRGRSDDYVGETGVSLHHQLQKDHISHRFK